MKTTLYSLCEAVFRRLDIDKAYGSHSQQGRTDGPIYGGYLPRKRRHNDPVMQHIIYPQHPGQNLFTLRIPNIEREVHVFADPSKTNQPTTLGVAGAQPSEVEAFLESLIRQL